MLNYENTNTKDGYFFSTKTFLNFPCAHRQWRHEGNCALVHGYSRSFVFVFASKTLNKCGFVVDYGNLDWIKSYLDYMFDHTLLLEVDDPNIKLFKELENAGACSIRHIEHGIGMEGTARHLAEWVNSNLLTKTKGRCRVISCEARENDKNSSIYFMPNHNGEWL